MGKTATELRAEIEERRDDLGRDFEAIGDRVSPARIAERKTEAVKSRFRSMKDAVMGTADDVTSTAHDTVAGVTGSAHDAAHNLAETAADVPDALKRQTEGNPLAAGLIAFGIGLLVASALPASRRERQLAQRVEPHLEDATRQVAAAGRELVDELKPVAEEHVQTLKDTATQAAQGIADDAKDIAHEQVQAAKHDTTEAARDVKASVSH